MAMSPFVPAILVGTLVLFGWRMIVGAIAARPLTDHVRRAALLAGADPGATDFDMLAGLHMAVGALSKAGHGAALVRAYYPVVRAIGRLLPGLAPWSEREMTVCSRYLAAQVDRCLSRNAACSRRVRTL